MPLRATQPVPEGLLPMSGQGLPLTRPDLLLSIIVRTKRSRASDLTSIKSDPRKSYSLATSGRFGVPPQPPVEAPTMTRSLSTQTGTTGWKYSEEEMKQAALLWYSSPKTYKLLRSFSPQRYPCPSTIRKYVQRFRCCFGINQEMFFLLSQKLQTLLEIDTNVALVFDEIALKPQTCYSQHLKMRLPPAKKAMVVMVRGLRKSFKEVIYYDFDRSMDMELLSELILQVERAGASVRAVTLDMGNQTLLKECKVNMNIKPYQSFIYLCFLNLGIPGILLLLQPKQYREEDLHLPGRSSPSEASPCSHLNQGCQV